MPARVEYRLGSIFDKECDLLVIPTTAGGTVTSMMADQLQKAVIPLPPYGMPGEEITWLRLPDRGYRFVAYAPALVGGTSSTDIIEQRGKEVGKLAFAQHLLSVSAPLPTIRADILPPDVVARALVNGFQQTAPEAAVLTITVTSATIATILRNEASGSATTSSSMDPGQVDTRQTPGTPQPGSASPTAPVTDGNPERTRVFISYSHADGEWLERLQKHLRPLERDGAMVWADTRIKAGAQWRDEIRAALAETKVAVLLVSADFMASEFIVTNELPPLLKAAEEEGAVILPVIISASSFLRTPSLSRFQAVNNPEKPLVQLRQGNREKVLDDVARAVEDALKR